MRQAPSQQQYIFVQRGGQETGTQLDYIGDKPGICDTQETLLKWFSLLNKKLTAVELSHLTQHMSSLYPGVLHPKSHGQLKIYLMHGAY